MTKSDLIDRLAQRFPQLERKDTALAVRAILERMTTTLAHNDRIEIRGFGSFALNYRPARLARNPKTGARVPVPGKHAPHFKPGLQLRQSVRDSQEDAALNALADARAGQQITRIALDEL